MEAFFREHRGENCRQSSNVTTADLKYTTVLLRLRSGHSSMDNHAATKVGLVPSPLCLRRSGEPDSWAQQDPLASGETLQTKLSGPRTGTGEDNSIGHADRTVCVISERQETKKITLLHFFTKIFVELAVFLINVKLLHSRCLIIVLQS